MLSDFFCPKCDKKRFEFTIFSSEVKKNSLLWIKAHCWRCKDLSRAVFDLHKEKLEDEDFRCFTCKKLLLKILWKENKIESICSNCHNKFSDKIDSMIRYMEKEEAQVMELAMEETACVSSH